MDHLLTGFAGDQWKQFVYNLSAEKALSPLLLLLPNGSLPSISHVYVLWVYLYYIYSAHSVYLCSGNRFIGWWEELVGVILEFLISVI